MITFVLNNNLIKTDKNPAMPLVDFIRYDKDLHGTKIGCREGDCGACTVLEGTLKNGEVIYQSIVSCITPLANVHGKHIVTIEGINLENRLSPVQQAIVDNAATQCGFCTPGFVMSFTGHCLSKQKSTVNGAINSVAGNICRCTGYQSIKKAAEAISECIQNKDIEHPVRWLVDKGYLPTYFLHIPSMLSNIEPSPISAHGTIIAGGTDLMVRQVESLQNTSIQFITSNTQLNGIRIESGDCIIGSSTTVNELRNSYVIQEILPNLKDQLALVSSPQIQNKATIAGNIVNASPIGGLSVILLALNTKVAIIDSNGQNKNIPLSELFIGYKKLNMNAGDLIQSFSFKIPDKPYQFNFEKISKRLHLDIASINSAMLIRLNGNQIVDCSISAGGVAPTPLFLKNTSNFLINKNISDEIIEQTNQVLQAEISPISDIRGSIEYKRLLMKQVLVAHLERFKSTINK